MMYHDMQNIKHQCELGKGIASNLFERASKKYYNTVYGEAKFDDEKNLLNPIIRFGYIPKSTHFAIEQNARIKSFIYYLFNVNKIDNFTGLAILKRFYSIDKNLIVLEDCDMLGYEDENVKDVPTRIIDMVLNSGLIIEEANERDIINTFHNKNNFLSESEYYNKYKLSAIYKIRNSKNELEFRKYWKSHSEKHNRELDVFAVSDQCNYLSIALNGMKTNNRASIAMGGRLGGGIYLAGKIDSTTLSYDYGGDNTIIKDNTYAALNKDNLRGFIPKHSEDFITYEDSERMTYRFSGYDTNNGLFTFNVDNCSHSVIKRDENYHYILFNGVKSLDEEVDILKTIEKNQLLILGKFSYKNISENSMIVRLNSPGMYIGQQASRIFAGFRLSMDNSISAVRIFPKIMELLYTWRICNNENTIRYQFANVINNHNETNRALMFEALFHNRIIKNDDGGRIKELKHNLEKYLPGYYNKNKKNIDVVLRDYEALSNEIFNQIRDCFIFNKTLNVNNLYQLMEYISLPRPLTLELYTRIDGKDTNLQIEKLRNRIRDHVVIFANDYIDEEGYCESPKNLNAKRSINITDIINDNDHKILNDDFMRKFYRSVYKNKHAYDSDKSHIDVNMDKVNLLRDNLVNMSKKSEAQFKYITLMQSTFLDESHT